MTFFTVKMRVTLTDIGRIAIIQIRIQIPDTRTVNTHIIAETQVRHIRQLIADTCRRYHIIKIFVEVITFAQQVFHFLLGMFIAHTQSSGNLLRPQPITHICSQNVVLMFVMRAMLFIQYIVSRSSYLTFITVVFRRVVTKNIFSSGFQCMYLADGCCIVSLKSMFRSILRTIVIQVIQTLQEVFPISSGMHVIISGV